MSQPAPIPVADAKRIAEERGYDQVIIVAWNAETGKNHITTYGTEPAQKKMAAQGGDRIAEILGLENATVYEDYVGPR
ncbi:MAG TPA: hypothetical protein VEY09_04515 [Pyrinomonadaceae bacterium]|nr:hypothetical protein [Pyrinomonadaceae bacterium]